MKPRHNRLDPWLLVPLLVGLCACSDGGSGSSASGTPDERKPLAGKAPTKTSQLEGRWVRVGEAEIEAMEFMQDGKGLIGGEDAGLTVDYSVLEGGRLSLALQGGMTTVLDAKIAGDELELTSSGNILVGAGTFRYRRLGADETVRGALAAQAKAKAEAYRKRVAALEEFLQQPGLVLAFTETGPGAPASIALEIRTSGGAFDGKAWHDDRPPHLNAISGQLLLDEAAQSAQVSITYGRRLAPPTTQPDGGGQIAMRVEGEGKGLRISASVTFGGSGPGHELVLRSDPKLHAQIVARFEAELARIEKLKQPMVALLKDYAVLRGKLQSADPRSIEPDTVELTLALDPKSGEYWVEGVFVGMRGRGDQLTDAGAEIAVVGDQPVLRIVTPPAREYQLSLPDPQVPALTGRWSTSGYNQANNAQFEVVEALDAGARDTRFEARRKALQSLSAGSVFTGLAFEDSGFGMEMPVPFRLELAGAADKSYSGKAHYPTLATVMTVAGQLAETSFGPRLQLSYPAVESTPGDKIFLRSIQSGSWRLVPTGGAGPLQLTGSFAGPPVRSTTLTRVAPDSTARLRARLVEVMGQGARFHVARYVGWQVPGQTPTVVEWKFDDASGKLTGAIVVDGRALGSNEKLVTSYTGELKQENGWLTLEVLQVAPYHPYDRWVGALKLYVAEDRNGVLHLNGVVVSLGAVRNDQPLPAFPTTFDRLVELVPVDATDATTRAAIEAAIASAERAKAEAEAAANAAQVAATDARRAKLAPFFPMFRSPAGLVITTDAPASLGTVLTAAVVDEEQATIRGRGVDLREMPLRDFTFECGIDNWGNLTVTTSLSATPYAFAQPKDGKVAVGRYMALTPLMEAERADLDARIALGRRLQSSAQAVLAVEILDPTTAKAREASLTASSMPGVALYKNAKNDKVAAMFTAQSNGRYRWVNEPVTQRLDAPMKGKALYIKNGGPTDNLVVIINGVHRASIPAIAQYGAAIVSLPPDLEVLDLRLQAEGTAQARGVVLLE